MSDTQICVPSAAITAWRIEFETAEMVFRCARPQFKFAALLRLESAIRSAVDFGLMSKDAGAEMMRAFGLEG